MSLKTLYQAIELLAASSVPGLWPNTLITKFFCSVTFYLNPHLGFSWFSWEPKIFFWTIFNRLFSGSVFLLDSSSRVSIVRWKSIDKSSLPLLLLVDLYTSNMSFINQFYFHSNTTSQFVSSKKAIGPNLIILRDYLLHIEHEPQLSDLR